MTIMRDFAMVATGLALGAAGALLYTRRHEENVRPALMANDAPSKQRPSTETIPCAEAWRQIADLNAQLQFREMLYHALWEEHNGHPIAWPTDTPIQYTEDGFRATMGAALEACDTELVPRGVECTEPPCFGAFIVTQAQQLVPKITDCPVWREAYGEAVTTYTTHVECEDGTEETVLLMAPYWTAIAEPASAMNAENYRKRVDAREGAMMEAWACAGE